MFKTIILCGKLLIGIKSKNDCKKLYINHYIYTIRLKRFIEKNIYICYISCEEGSFSVIFE